MEQRTDTTNAGFSPLLPFTVDYRVVGVGQSPCLNLFVTPIQFSRLPPNSILRLSARCTTFATSFFSPSSLLMASPPPFPTATAQKHKVVFVGDEGVGKTAILSRFNDGSFDPRSLPTVGSDLITKTIHITPRQQQQHPSTTTSVVVKLQIWDTAGQERFRSLIPSHLQDTSAAVVVYDVTHRPSFDHVEDWIALVRRCHCPLILLVGNKTEIARHQRQVTPEEGLQTSMRHKDVIFLETSARAGYNTRYLFALLSAGIVEQKKKQRRSSSNNDQQLKSPTAAAAAVPESPSTTSRNGDPLDGSTSSWSNFLETVHKSLLPVSPASTTETVLEHEVAE